MASSAASTIDIPDFFRVRQHFDRPLVEDVKGAVERAVGQSRLAEKIQPGQSVALTVGSRGIAQIATITKAVVDQLKRIGAQPFIVPAMGSHGGGTPDGQRGVLATYGITPETMGCKIRSSMETVVVCQATEGFPVHFDANAFQADHVLVMNRVKPHTRFFGSVKAD